MPNHYHLNPPRAHASPVSSSSLAGNADDDPPPYQWQLPGIGRVLIPPISQRLHPQRMGGLLSYFPQASNSPQSAMHADIQYSRDTNPVPPYEWQLPIGQLLTPSTSQLHPLQAMSGLPYIPQASDRPQSAMHTDIQYSRDNNPTPTAVLDVVRSAVDTISRQNEVISNAKDELCRSEIAGKLLEKTIQELEKEREEMKKERCDMKKEMNNLRGEMEKMRQDMRINVGELTRQRHQLEDLKSGVGQISEELSNFELSEIQENDKKIQGGRFSLIRKPLQWMPEGLVRIHNAIRVGDGNDVDVEIERIREFEGFKTVLMDEWNLKIPPEITLLANYAIESKKRWSDIIKSVRYIKIEKSVDFDTPLMEPPREKFVINCYSSVGLVART